MTGHSNTMVSLHRADGGWLVTRGLQLIGHVVRNPDPLNRRDLWGFQYAGVRCRGGCATRMDAAQQMIAHQEARRER